MQHFEINKGIGSQESLPATSKANPEQGARFRSDVLVRESNQRTRGRKETFMTNEHINKQGMYLVVIQVLNKFTALVATMPALAKLVASFTQTVTNIGTKSEEIGIGTSPKTDAKRKAESDMADAVIALVGKLHAYAAGKNDVELMEETDVPATVIHDKRDAERGKFAARLVDLVEEHQADLAGDYIVTDADIANARQLIAGHDGTLGDRNSTKTGQTGGRDAVMQMFAQADSMLEHQIDNLMLSFKKTNPDFYAEYEAARVIRDIAAHHKGKNDGGKNGGIPKPPDGKK
ncbi:MAG TPA: hypothetical protein VLX91_08210 [Candidatus Acidoferrales bacterium]|nr:hypothetical protein [Candidatus Acidoferrales bacterium]